MLVHTPNCYLGYIQVTNIYKLFTLLPNIYTYRLRSKYFLITEIISEVISLAPHFYQQVAKKDKTPEPFTKT